MTTTIPRTPTRGASVGEPGARTRNRHSWLPTLILVLGAVYCLIPVAWVIIASSKSPGELFSTFTMAPGRGLGDNLAALFRYEDGQFGLWAANSLLYAGGGAVLSTLVSTMAGYGLSKYRFAGQNVIFYGILAGVLIPGITLAIPQYLLLSSVHLAGTTASVLLPSIISPFGIYLSRVYAAAALPEETIEAARIDGASEWRIFRSIALPLLVPGMVTVFLLQFIGIWNNFLLPYVMLSDQSRYPLTVGLYTLLNKGSSSPALYSVAITGAAVSIIPLIALVLFLQRYWRLDLLSGGMKG